MVTMHDNQTMPSGQIGVFGAALAGDAASFGHAFSLLGPGMESVKHERPDGSTDTMLHFASSGGSMRLRAGKPIAIRIPLRSDSGEPVYREPGALIDGIDGDSTREHVNILLGEPARASQIMDLYLYGNEYVRFDYQDGRVDVVSLVAAGVED